MKTILQRDGKLYVDGLTIPMIEDNASFRRCMEEVAAGQAEILQHIPLDGSESYEERHVNEVMKALWGARVGLSPTARVLFDRSILKMENSQ